MELARKLSAWDASAVVIGTVIGGGIFVVPALIALAYAELGAMMPCAVGFSIYLGYLLPLTVLASKVCSVALILLLSGRGSCKVGSALPPQSQALTPC